MPHFIRNTRHPSHLLRHALLALSLAPACTYDSSADDPLAARTDQLIDELNAQNAVYCDCYDEWGYADRAQCEGEDAIGPSQRRCITDAFARDAEASQQYLDCMLPLEREFTGCANSRAPGSWCVAVEEQCWAWRVVRCWDRLQRKKSSPIP